MTTLADAYVRLRPDVTSLGPELARRVQGPAKVAGGGFGKDFASGALATFFGNIASTQVFNAFTGILTSMWGEARESAVIGRLTEQAIRSTGGAAKISAGQVGDLAESLSEMIGVDDEAIQGAENLLLSFTKIQNRVGKGNDIFNQATRAVADLAAGLNNGAVTSEGMHSAALQLGKALNDPIKGIGALSRAGVSFTQGQKDQIVALVKAGKTMDAQKIILKELNTEFGGMARAAADPAQKAAVAWGNFKERIGTLVMPAVLGLAGAFTGKLLPALEAKVVPAVQRVAAFISDRLVPGVQALAARWLPILRQVFGDVAALIGGEIVPRFQALAGVWLPRLAAVFAAIASVIVNQLVPGVISVVSFFARHETLTKTLAVAIGTLVVVTKAYAAAMLVTAAITKIVAAGGLLKFIAAAITSTTAWTAVQWLLNIAMSLNPISLIIIAIGVLVAGIVWIATKTTWFQTIWRVTWTHVKAWAQAVAAWFMGTIVPSLKRSWDMIVAGVRAAVNFYVAYINLIRAVVSAVFRFVSAYIQAQINVVLAVVRRIIQVYQWFRDTFERARQAVVLATTAMVAWLKGLPGRILAAIGDLGSLLVNAGRQLVEGLWNGIKSLAGWLAGKVRGFIADNVPGPVQKLLGIASRSKLFEYFGRQTVEGYVQGWQRALSGLSGLPGSLVAAAGPPPALAGARGLRLHRDDLADLAAILDRRPVILQLDGRQIDYALGDRATRLGWMT